MFSIRSWTDSDPELPYHAACACKVDQRFASERERWLWIQAHHCPPPGLKIFYLDSKRKANDASK